MDRGTETEVLYAQVCLIALPIKANKRQCFGKMVLNLCAIPIFGAAQVFNLAYGMQGECHFEDPASLKKSRSFTFSSFGI